LGEPSIPWAVRSYRLLMEIPISFPLDSEGFVRRECPSCEREFKWLWADSDEEATQPSSLGYSCPYCAAWAQPDQWFTEAQVEHIRASAMGPVKDEVDQIFSGLKALRYKPGERLPTPPKLPAEPDDMRRVEFDCHPDDPLKLIEGWTGPIHCLICSQIKR
jgi:hypothetical protein